jgi:hypothetical protein
MKVTEIGRIIRDVIPGFRQATFHEVTEFHPRQVSATWHDIEIRATLARRESTDRWDDCLIIFKLDERTLWYEKVPLTESSIKGAVESGRLALVRRFADAMHILTKES